MGYSGLSVLLPLRLRLGHLSWNNSGGFATEITSIDVLAALARPFQGYPSVLSCTPAVEFYPEVVGLCAPY
jgi:hypothetical protein